MDKNTKALLAIPVLILLLGFFLLLSGEVALWQNHALSPLARYHLEQGIRLQPPSPADTAVREAMRANRDSAYPYFLLGAGLLVLVLVLPRLSEFSFSPTGGIAVKVLNEAKEAVKEATATSQAIIAKAEHATPAAQAPESLLRAQPDIRDDIKKLEEHMIRLTAYTDILEKLGSPGNKGPRT